MTTTSNAASAPTADSIGLFPINYEVSTGLPGAPVLHLQLIVSTPDHYISGVGVVTQAVNPPLDVRSAVQGSYVVEDPSVGPIEATLLGDGTGHVQLSDG